MNILSTKTSSTVKPMLQQGVLNKNQEKFEDFLLVFVKAEL